ncbi:MAG TPA: hypothetical protein PLH48_02845 [Acinetobacter johnsonii]|nr:hypothetical protein [Acinetobacter johnsonii]
MDIYKHLINMGPEVFYEPGFRIVLEDHLTYLINHPSSEVFTVEPGPAHKYEGDFYGLLQAYKLPAYMHWIIMRMNSMTSPMEYRDNKLDILKPSAEVLEKIRNTYKSQTKLKK